MSISEQTLEEIRVSADIVDVISENVELKPFGNEFKGLCPFHSEKTPSFHVSREKGVYHCFGCGASGNIFSFIMKFHNLDFLDAVKYVAEKLNIAIEDDTNYKEKSSLININNYFCELCNKLLLENKDASDYLKLRNFDEQICEEFKIGYLPSNKNFDDIYHKFNNNTVYESGIFYKKDGKVISRFSGRIIIPIQNITGKTIGFSGRVLDKSLPKYVNSPETPLFVKRKVLYNLNRAKDFIKKSNTVYVVEGYFDVMRMHQYGYKNVVSPMGTSLTKEQITMLKRYADEVVLIFDGDEAGKKAALRSIDIFLELNFLPKVVFLSSGNDPDSILMEKGKVFFNRLLDSKEDLLLYIAKRNNSLSKNYNEKIKSINLLKKKIINIKNLYLKEYYLKEISKIYEIDYEILKSDTENELLTQLKNKTVENKGIDYICEESFLCSFFYLDVDVISSLIEDVEPSYFFDKRNSFIFKKMVEKILNNGSIHTLLNDSEVGEYVSRMLANYIEPTDIYAEVIKNKSKLLLNHLDNVKQEKLKKLNENPEKTSILIKEIDAIVKRQIQIKKNLLEE